MPCGIAFGISCFGRALSIDNLPSASAIGGRLATLGVFYWLKSENGQLVKGAYPFTSTTLAISYQHCQATAG
jgi:hypothetical protein